MNFTCPHCGHGAFTIVGDSAGSQSATCNKCGKVTPLKKQQMTGPETDPIKQRKLHLK